MMMKERIQLLILATCALSMWFTSCKPQSNTEVLEIFHTTDIHGNYLSYDFIADKEGTGSLARVASYVGAYRKSGDNVLLLEGGDLLQGQPTAYYYNFVDTMSKHFAAEVLNFMDYDAMVIGNHDIETGHPVYDRFAKSLACPVLGANVIDEVSSDRAARRIPYFQPYTIVSKGTKKIAIIGVITPELTTQLPEILWSGLRFDDQIETIKSYIPEIMEQGPNLVIALIHSGSGSKSSSEWHPMNSNVAYQLATEVPELDVVFCGHDHTQKLDSVPHDTGRTTYILNPGANGDLLSHVTVKFSGKEDKRLQITAKLVDMNKYTPDPTFVQKFAGQLKVVKDFVGQRVGHINEDLDAKVSFFGPSKFNDLIHALQFNVFDSAQISITAPLSEEAVVPSGDLYMRDLFKLYKYENMVYLMSLTGAEVQGHLEESYDRWIYTMTKPSDPLIRIDEKKRGGRYLPLQNPSFNFDTTAGISYTVDVSKPRGERIHISAVGKSEIFHPDSIYRVVMNSYRGNGGGGLLTQGAHLTQEQIKERLIKSTDKDLRFFLMHFLQQHDPYQPHTLSQWCFIPEEWMKEAIPRDSTLLFQK